MFSTVFVLTIHLCANSLTIYIWLPQFRDYHQAVGRPLPLIKWFLYINHGKNCCTFDNYYRCLPVRSFAKNQLSSGTISISHLTTPHRRILQHSPVRSCNNLGMVRSPGFGSNLSNLPSLALNINLSIIKKK